MGNIIAFNPCLSCEREDMCTMCELALRRSGSIPSNKWISVNERLPEKSKMVLCFYPEKDYGSKCVVDYAETNNGHFAEQFRYGTPSHWMPLPDAPKGGAE